MREYTTTQGDTWDLISYKVYGSEKRTHVLMQANISNIDISIFPADLKLIVPELTSGAVKRTTPPWKRGTI